MLAPCRAASVARGLLQLGRPEVVRRRVDQIARERHALGDAREVGAVDALGNFELRAVRVRLAVAGELVGAEREGERGEARVVRRVGEAVGAGRQQAGQAAGQEAVLVRLVGALRGRTGRRSARRPRRAAAATGRASARTSRSRRTRRAGGVEPLAHLRVGVGGDEPDRNRRGAARETNAGCMESPREGRPASTAARRAGSGEPAGLTGP